jgi:recombination protein RecA
MKLVQKKLKLERMMSKLASLAAALGEPTTTAPVAASKKKEVETIQIATKEDKFKVLTELNKSLNKQFDVNVSLVRLGDRVGVRVPSISTNLPSLDEDVIQSGGVPRGRIVEIFGPESAGKTTLALHIVACEQKATDNLCAYVDAEHSLDPTYASTLGVNVDELVIAQPDSGEQALTIVEDLIDSKAVSLVVIDSVAALVPQAELDGEMGDSNMGLQARLLSQAMRKLRGKANINGVTLIFINQIREKIGVMFGSPETTTGGRALKFFSSLRLDVRRKDPIGPKEQPIGHVLKIKGVKNKMGAPMRETLVNLLYGKGIDTFADTISYAVKIGVIEQSGAWYSYQGERIAYGLENVIEKLRSEQELFNKIRVKIVEKTTETCNGNTSTGQHGATSSAQKA